MSNDAAKKNEFGIMPARVASLTDKIAQIRPDQSAALRANEGDQEVAKRIDQAATSIGFTSREPLERLRRKRSVEPVTNLNMRPTIALFNTFVMFCEKNGNVPYQEGLAKLLQMAHIDAEGNVVQHS